MILHGFDMINVAAVVLPGTFMSSLAPLIDAFDLTQERGERLIGADVGSMPNVRLTLLSADGQDMPTSRHGRLRIERPISSDDDFDFIWIPSFRSHGEAGLRGTMAGNRPLIEWLQRIAERGTVIGASGAAAALPMSAHLAEGVKVPVAAPLVPVFRALFPRFRHAADTGIVHQRGLLLSRGIGHDVHAVTELFTRFFSPETGRWLRSVFGNEALQDEGLPDGEPRDQLVATARLMLEQRFSSTVSIAALAAELAVSHAVLIRHFRNEMGMTPSRYVQQLRLGAAQRMLVHTTRSIDSIAAAVGYGDARLFREMFRKATGISATEWRKSQ
ncbi:transcriptional regulator GlxA family with amidase domain [Novosphingobium taihuense]|nr:transcriptional regulator GlxA family with amidase domain [Novosphingobium taihuense]